MLETRNLQFYSSITLPKSPHFKDFVFNAFQYGKEKKKTAFMTELFTTEGRNNSYITSVID